VRVFSFRGGLLQIGGRWGGGVSEVSPIYIYIFMQGSSRLFL
jgi:hypothetical protein